MFRKIRLSPTPQQRIVKAALRKEYQETPSHRHWAEYEPVAPRRLDFNDDSAVDWSLLDSDDRFAGGAY